ncbi:hypothetical protein JW979_06700, partial [bacterium]|nr:hypothetical protein [candidate division CSSED10-310 bacterium]
MIDREAFPVKGWPGRFLINYKNIRELGSVYRFLFILSTCWTRYPDIFEHFRLVRAGVCFNTTEMECWNEDLDLYLNIPSTATVVDILNHLNECFSKASGTIGNNSRKPLKADTEFKGLNVCILNPSDIRDLRWQRTGLAMASKIIAELLQLHGHQARIESIHLGGILPEFHVKPDAIIVGFYDDLFEDLRKVVRFYKSRYRCWIVAGGPMAILSPGALAVHLPEADIILRGEAESYLPDLVDRLAFITHDNILSNEQIERLLDIPGLFFRGRSFLLSHSFEKSPVSTRISGIGFFHKDNPDDFLINGLELSTSRGCPRSCAFCSHVHGKILRKMSLDDFENALDGYCNFLKRCSSSINNPPEAYTVNINDDDILLDAKRCLEIVRLLKRKGMKIWGIQTSLDSLGYHSSESQVLRTLADGTLYPGGVPVFWIGTDVFISQRQHRLNKSDSSRSVLDICGNLDRNGITGYHYWILTDAESTWQEFFDELQMILEIGQKYPDSFRVLPNAGCLVPYPSTSIFQKREHQNLSQRFILKKKLHIDGYPEFDYPLLWHERPESNYLYALVEPNARVAERVLISARDFLSDIKKGKYYSAFERAF